jgi:outer membrane protein assembly factor BamB
VDRAAGAEPQAGSRPVGYWQKLPYIPGRAEYTHDIGLEPGDVLWVIAGTGIAYWDGQQFRRPVNTELGFGPSICRFVGGRDRGLYVVQRGSEEHWGKIYRLSDGRALYVADFHYDDAGSPPPLYVSRSGRLFNWAKDFVAFHTGEGWERSQAVTRPAHVRVFDTGESVYFYCDHRLYGVDGDGRVTTRDVPVAFPDDTASERAAMKGALWGRDKAILLKYGGKGIFGFELATGRPVDVSSVNQVLGDGRVYDLFRTRDGSVWVLFIRHRLRGYVFCRITPEGNASLIESAARFGWDNHQFWQSPQIVLSASDGSLWFGRYHKGILRYKDDAFFEFDGSGGLSLSSCLCLLEDSRGRIYAQSSRGVYVFHSGQTAPPATAVARRPTIPRKVVWKHLPTAFHSLARAWRVGSSICFTTTQEGGVSILDAATGTVQAELHIDRYTLRCTWCAAGRHPGEVMLSDQKRITVADTQTGHVRERTDYRRDWRVSPTPLDDGYLVVKGRIDCRLVRIDRSGSEIWECRLPGDVRLHPTVYGSMVVVQTRDGGSTTAVDLNTGQRLWSERTGGGGCGAAFGDDAAFVVEAEYWLSPRATKGRLICREPKTGRQRWHYQRTGTIGHTPVVQPQSDRVFAVFDRGAVVCLDATDGRLLWETHLPENPYPAVALFYDPYWPTLALDGDRLMVVDRNNVLHFLDAGSGSFAASVALTTAFGRDGKTMAPAKILAMPWIEGDNLIVTTTRGAAAYRIRELLQQE